MTTSPKVFLNGERVEWSCHYGSQVIIATGIVMAMSKNGKLAYVHQTWPKEFHVTIETAHLRPQAETHDPA